MRLEQSFSRISYTLNRRSSILSYLSLRSLVTGFRVIPQSRLRNRPARLGLGLISNSSCSSCKVGLQVQLTRPIFQQIARDLSIPVHLNRLSYRSVLVTTRQQALTMATRCSDTVESETGEAHLDHHDDVDSSKNKMQTVAKDASCDMQLVGDRVNKSERSGNIQQMSKRAQKKLHRKEKLKESRKAKREPNFTKNSNPGFNRDIFDETDYYFENGLRKVYPYPFTFSTYAKERWYGRTIKDIFENEFRVDSPDNFRTSVAKGNMKVNGKVIGLDYCLKNGDLIEHQIHRHENPVSGAQIEIIADTPDLVVINKPASIPCHPCGKFRFNSIVFILGKEFGYANLRNIYRLDRLTSGVLIMGKTARKTKELENQVLHRRVYKEYVARVVGEFPDDEVVVDQPLDCLSHKLTLWRVRPGGKPSRTTFQRISYNGKTSIVRCIPHTGRTHQIRVHLQYLGHPIVNDPYYNSPSWGPLRGKGGHCDVSHEELCQRIMQEHNVGMWCEGENPLFKDRLSVENIEEVSSNTRETGEACTGSDDTPAAGMPKDADLSDPDKAVSPPLPKRPRLSTEQSEPSVSDKTVHVDTGDSVLRPSPDSTTSSSALAEEAKIETCVENTLTVPPTTENVAADTEESVSNSGLAEAVSADNAGPVIPRVKVEQKAFDPKRWVPDPLCESCRLKYIDPKPHDLLLYLHAIRYKGPTWDYSTELPSWAADDWMEPEEYGKYFQ